MRVKKSNQSQLWVQERRQAAYRSEGELATHEVLRSTEATRAEGAMLERSQLEWVGPDSRCMNANCIETDWTMATNTST